MTTLPKPALRLRCRASALDDAALDAGESLAQLGLEELAGGVAGQLGKEVHFAGALEMRQPFAAPGDQFVGAGFLLGGWVGARRGLNRTLVAGLLLQIVALMALTFESPTTADRQEHVLEELAPALEVGKVVLVDRYYLSTVAYQGARGLDPTELLKANSFAPAPDLLIVLDIDPKLGLQRIRERGDLADLFEREDELARARSIFRELSIPNLHFIDARLPAHTIHEKIFSLLMEKLHPSDGERITPKIELKLRAV